MNQYKKGFSLIEVLIAVVILSFGLLSIATLQIKAKAASYDSIQRSTATQLTQDIIEKMRANPTAADFYDGDYPDDLDLDLECGTSLSCIQAGKDIADWWAEMTSTSGGMEVPFACITKSATAGYFKITITWRGVENIAYTGTNNCGTIKTDGFRRLITIDVFISKEGLG